jgi:hypothetical protein
MRKILEILCWCLCGLGAAYSAARSFCIRSGRIALVTAALLVLGGNALPGFAGGLPPMDAKIQAAIAGGNVAQTRWAAAQIAALLETRTHYGAPTRLCYTWLPLLMQHHDYAAVAKLARLQILLNPGDHARMWEFKLWRFQTYRTTALLLMGRQKAALRNAKSLFNVVPINETSQAAKLLYRCLWQQKSDGPALAREFVREQIAGSPPPAPGHKPKSCTVLAGITVHAQAYMAGMQKQKGAGTMVLVAKGNLLLLADHPNRAMQCFKQAYDIATPRQLPMVCDRIAAAIRAKYGTIGAANAWLESIAR